MDEKKIAWITLSLQFGRITIGRSALEALGMPESVLLLVSPEQPSLVLTDNPCQDPRGVKVRFDTKGSMRIRSLSLCRAIASLIPGPLPESAIRLSGTVTEQGIRFPLTLPSEGKGGISS